MHTNCSITTDFLFVSFAMIVPRRSDIDSPLPLALMDTSSEDTVYIQEELIRLGHAASTEVVHTSEDCVNCKLFCF